MTFQRLLSSSNYMGSSFKKLIMRLCFRWKHVPEHSPGAEGAFSLVCPRTEPRTGHLTGVQPPAVEAHDAVLLGRCRLGCFLQVTLWLRSRSGADTCFGCTGRRPPDLQGRASPRGLLAPLGRSPGSRTTCSETALGERPLWSSETRACWLPSFRTAWRLAFGRQGGVVPSSAP